MQEARRALNMINLGYRDYLAARVLFQNGLFVQGATFAGFAIEKYLKSVLLKYGVERDLHIDKWKTMKGILSRHDDPIFQQLDENFLTVLEKTFLLRYYDRVATNVYFGFIHQQLLAELDFAINLIDNKFKFTNETKGFNMDTEYKSDLKKAEPKLLAGNHVLAGLPKQEVMERKGDFVLIHLSKEGSELVGKGPIQQLQYSGSLIVVKKVTIKTVPEIEKGSQISIQWSSPVNF